jgi:hypothetical protein
MISTGATQRAETMSVSAADTLAMLCKIAWLICQRMSRNVSSTIMPLTHTLQPKIHSVLPLHSFQLMTHLSLHCVEITMHISRLIPQTGVYLDLMKMSPLSSKLPMAMLAMISIIILFQLFSPRHLFQYIISGVSHLRGCIGV